MTLLICLSAFVALGLLAIVVVGWSCCVVAARADRWMEDYEQNHG